MTQLRPRRSDDLHLSGLSARTQERDVRALRPLAAHDHTSPDGITDEALRASCLALKNGPPSSRRARTSALGGITLFSEHPGQRAWTPLTFVRPPREQNLPVRLRLAEVRPLLAPLTRLRSRGGRTPIDACGRRLPEGPHRQGADMDRARRLLHVRGGTGAKDRSVPLPQPPLEWRRQAWKTPRHPVWIWPAPGRGGSALPTATAPMPRSRGQGAVREALTARGLQKRAAVHTLRPSDAPHLLAAGVHLRRLQADWGHTTPTTTAISTPLPLKAEALAREALTRLMTDR